MSNNIIRFQLGNENYPVVEDLSKKDVFDKSIFHDQYIHAFEAIERHLEELRSASEDGNEDKNNIFAFLGDRGSGKTSCMKSVARALCESQKLKSMMLENAGIDCPSLLSRTFVQIGMIDPSFFDEHHNILEILIAQMFKSFRKRCENLTDRIVPIDQQKLVKKFQTAQKDMRNMFDKNEGQYSSVEQLQYLSAAVDLRKDIYELVRTYCTVMGYGDDAILVVRVDDIDLNTSQAARMAEEIRKYFVQPNVIVLMAMKYEQMDMVKQLEYAKEYEKLLKEDAKDVIRDMSQRYLIKFLPEEQHVYMPEGRFFAWSQLQLMRSDDTPESGFEDEQCLPFVADYLTDSIFEKTSYVFLNSSQKSSYIVPQNLRDLRQLIKVLAGMKKGRTSVNQQTFQNYLFDSFALKNVGLSARDAIFELRNLSTGSNVNAQVIRLIRSRYQGNILKQCSDGEIGYIQDINNITENISLGDVMALIDYVEKRVCLKDDFLFLFLIKTLYTVKMHEFASHADRAELKGLIGGRYFNTSYFDSIPTSSGRSRSYMRIDNQAVRKVLSVYLSNPYQHLTLLPVLQFFLLGISRKYDRSVASSKPEVVDYAYRTKQNMTADESFSPEQVHVVFDISAFMYNVIDQNTCVKRFLNNDEDPLFVADPTFLLDYDEIQQLNSKLQNTRFDRVEGEDLNVYIRYFKVLADYERKDGSKPLACFNSLVKALLLILTSKPQDNGAPAPDPENPYVVFMNILRSGLNEREERVAPNESQAQPFQNKYYKSKVFGYKKKYSHADINKCVDDNAPELKQLEIWDEWYQSVVDEEYITAQQVNELIVKVNKYLSLQK